MTNIAIVAGSSLIDVVIREFGTLEALFDIALLNGIEISHKLESGQVLKVDDGQEYEIAGFVFPETEQRSIPLTRVSEGQNLLDIVLQETGSLEGLFDMAALNGLLPSQELSSGQVLRRSQELKPDLVKYFAGKNHRVNTGASYVAPQNPDAPSEYFDYTFDFKLS